MTTTGFGWITYQDKKYENDILVLPSGKAVERNEIELKKKYGNMHVVSKEEMELLLKEKPKIIFFGTGQTGLARLSKEARELLIKTLVMIIEKPTPDAVRRFDVANGSKAAIFHITC